jgi:hypothetical protein
MSIELIYYVSQIASSVAVVASIIYLALQVRQAERSQRAVTQQIRADRVSEFALRLAEGPASLLNRGARGDPDLSPEEFQRFSYLARAMFISAEDSVLQYTNGLMDESAYISFRKSAEGTMGQPGLRAIWNAQSPLFGRDMNAFMRKICEDVPLTQRPDAFDAWKGEVDSLRKTAGL